MKKKKIAAAAITVGAIALGIYFIIVKGRIPAKAIEVVEADSVVGGIGKVIDSLNESTSINVN